MLFTSFYACVLYEETLVTRETFYTTSFVVFSGSTVTVSNLISDVVILVMFLKTLSTIVAPLMY